MTKTAKKSTRKTPAPAPMMHISAEKPQTVAALTESILAVLATPAGDDVKKAAIASLAGVVPGKIEIVGNTFTAVDPFRTEP